MSKKRRALILFSVLLVLCLCFFPIPLRVRMEMDALFYPRGAAEPQPCAISLDGVRSIYLFKEDQYDGAFVVSNLPETSEYGARLETFLGDGMGGPLWYRRDDPAFFDDPVIDLGAIRAPADFSWFYLYLSSDEKGGFFGEIIAPASMGYDEMHALLGEGKYLDFYIPS